MQQFERRNPFECLLHDCLNNSCVATRFYTVRHFIPTQLNIRPLHGSLDPMCIQFHCIGRLDGKLSLANVTIICGTTFSSISYIEKINKIICQILITSEYN